MAGGMRDEFHPGQSSASAEAGLRAVFDAMDALVMVRDASGRVSDVNAGFLKAFGGQARDWIGRWFDVFRRLTSPSRRSRIRSRFCAA